MKSLLVALMIVASVGCEAAVVLISNPITGTNPNTSNPYTIGQTVASNLTFSGIGRGTGATGTTANDRYNASSWNTVDIDPTAYFNFILAPEAGYFLNLSSFDFTGQISATGPTSFALRSSLDNFTADIGLPTAGASPGLANTIDLSAPVFQNLTSGVEFRLYAWNTTNSGGTFSVNDFSFSGTVTAIPEPSRLALLGFAGGCMLMRRRRP